MKQPTNALEKIEDIDRFSRMLNTGHIDKKKIMAKGRKSAGTENDRHTCGSYRLVGIGQWDRGGDLLFQLSS